MGEGGSGAFGGGEVGGVREPRMGAILGELDDPGENLDHQECRGAVKEAAETLDLIGVRVMTLLHVQGQVPVQQRQGRQYAHTAGLRNKLRLDLATPFRLDVGRDQSARRSGRHWLRMAQNQQG